MTPPTQGESIRNAGVAATPHGYTPNRPPVGSNLSDPCTFCTGTFADDGPRARLGLCSDHELAFNAWRTARTYAGMPDLERAHRAHQNEVEHDAGPVAPGSFLDLTRPPQRAISVWIDCATDDVLAFLNSTTQAAA